MNAQRVVVAGRAATAVTVDGHWTPTDRTKDVAFVKVLFDDGGVWIGTQAVHKSDPGPSDVHSNTSEWRRPTWLQRQRRHRLPPQLREALLRDNNTVLKAEPTQQLLTGWASIIEAPDGTPVVDSQGDIIDESELTVAARTFMREARVVCDNHERVPGPDGTLVPKAVGTVVESLVVTRALKAALNLPPSTPTGWIVTMHIEDPTVWAEVVDGRRTGLSIGGTAIREEVGGVG